MLEVKDNFDSIDWLSGLNEDNGEYDLVYTEIDDITEDEINLLFMD